MAALLRRTQSLGLYLVSILVLLDWRWRQTRMPRQMPTSSPFQSLFCWIGDGGGLVVQVRENCGVVSILVLLDWRWRPPNTKTDAGCTHCFNPCSVGLEMAAIDDGTSDAGTIGFNPCSVGLEMAAGCAGIPRCWSAWFQSLFCWIGDGGAHPLRRRQGGGRFQSLFCWIGDGGVRRSRQPLTGVWVSILVLLDWRWRPHLP